MAFYDRLTLLHAALGPNEWRELEPWAALRAAIRVLASFVQDVIDQHMAVELASWQADEMVGQTHGS